MTTIIRLGARVAVLSVLGAFAATAQAQDKTDFSKETIRLGVGVDPAFATIYYAHQKHLFAKHGLNIQITQYAHGADGIDTMVAGQAELSTASEATVMIRAARADVRALGIYSWQTAYIRFVVRKGIDKLSQVKKFGVVPGSVSELCTILLLEKFKIDEKSVSFVKGGPPVFPALLARGDVDGYFMWEPWPSNGVKLGGKVLYTSADVGYTATMVIAAMGPWLEKHMAEAKAFMATLADANAQLRADRSKAAAATHAEIKMSEAQAAQLLTSVGFRVRDFSDKDIATYRKIADFEATRKVTPVKVDIDKFLMKGFVKGIK
jgi:NitT/TauT family transport system substrate-binding protein